MYMQAKAIRCGGCTSIRSILYVSFTSPLLEFNKTNYIIETTMPNSICKMAQKIMINGDVNKMELNGNVNKVCDTFCYKRM